MGFKFLERISQQKKAEYLEHCRPEIVNLSCRRKKLSLAEYQELRLNSWEFVLIHRNLDNEALLYVIHHSYSNSQFKSRSVFDPPPMTYDTAIVTEYLPLLLGRFSELLNEEPKEL